MDEFSEVFGIHIDQKTLLKSIRFANVENKTESEGEECLILAKRDMEDCSPMIYFGGLLLIQLDQVDRAKKYFEMLLKSLSFDHPDIGSVYNNLGNVYFKKSEFILVLKNYEKGYKIRRAHLPSDHSHITSSLRNIGLIYKCKKKV